MSLNEKIKDMTKTMLTSYKILEHSYLEWKNFSKVFEKFQV